jgi:hypothetical protein
MFTIVDYSAPDRMFKRVDVFESHGDTAIARVIIDRRAGAAYRQAYSARRLLSVYADDPMVVLHAIGLMHDAMRQNSRQAMAALISYDASSHNDYCYPVREEPGYYGKKWLLRRPDEIGDLARYIVRQQSSVRVVLP